MNGVTLSLLCTEAGTIDRAEEGERQSRREVSDHLLNSINKFQKAAFMSPGGVARLLIISCDSEYFKSSNDFRHSHLCTGYSRGLASLAYPRSLELNVFLICKFGLILHKLS